VCTSVVSAFRCQTVEVDETEINVCSLNLSTVLVNVNYLESYYLLLIEAAGLSVCTDSVIVAEVVTYLSLDYSIRALVAGKCRCGYG